MAEYKSITVEQAAELYLLGATPERRSPNFYMDWKPCGFTRKPTNVKEFLSVYSYRELWEGVEFRVEVE